MFLYAKHRACKHLIGHVHLNCIQQKIHYTRNVKNQVVKLCVLCAKDRVDCGWRKVKFVTITDFNGISFSCARNATSMLSKQNRKTGKKWIIIVIFVYSLEVLCYAMRHVFADVFPEKGTSKFIYSQAQHRNYAKGTL